MKLYDVCEAPQAKILTFYCSKKLIPFTFSTIWKEFSEIRMYFFQWLQIFLYIRPSSMYKNIFFIHLTLTSPGGAHQPNGQHKGTFVRVLDKSRKVRTKVFGGSDKSLRNRFELPSKLPQKVRVKLSMTVYYEPCDSENRTCNNIKTAVIKLTRFDFQKLLKFGQKFSSLC